MYSSLVGHAGQAPASAALTAVEGDIRDREAKMCMSCAAGAEGGALARRAHVLRLLALVEHPDALPADVVLRLAREILALTRAERTGCRCDLVASPESGTGDARWRRRS